MKNIPRLSNAERDSACWQKVEAYLKSELARLRQLNENPRTPEAERLGFCWRISEIKELLKLGQPQPTEPQGDDAG